MKRLFSFVFWNDARTINKMTNGKGTILDIGCGDGGALLALQKLGDFKLYGLEQDPVAAERAQKQGLDVRSGDLMAAGYAERLFDLVRMGHVIEHVTNPAEILRRTFDLLKTGGVLFGETPNTESIDARFFKRYWGCLHIPRHTVLFGRSNLKRALQDAGFTDIVLSPRLRTVGWSASIQNILVDRFKLPIPPSGRVQWYILLILAFLPFTAVQALFGNTGSIAFFARKPVDPHRKSCGQ